MLHVYLFGGISLQHDEMHVSAPSSQTTRSLFAYLVVYRERTHTRTLLAGLLWPEHPEETARRRLSHALWELRQAFNDLPTEISYFVATQQRIGFNPEAPCWIDVAEFERRADYDDTEHAPLSALRDAVDLYRGDFLAGFYDDWVLLERERLRNRYLQTLDRLIQCCKAEALYREALTYARRLAQHDPLREKAHREVIRLYHLLGRPHEAIQQYERYRNVLAEELGAQPSPVMQALHREVRSRLTSDEHRHWPTPTLPRSPLLEGEEPAPFVGRESERATLVHAMEKTLRGSGGVVFVEGEPGVGKTRLLDVARDDANWRGIQTLWGQARAGDEGSPYGAIRDALSRTLTPLRVRRLADVLEPVWLQELARFIPAIGELTPTAHPRPDLSPDREQQRPLEALVQLLLALEQFSPLLMVLDDVQWADEGTLNVLTRLAARVQERQLLAVIGYRGEAARAKKQVWETIRALDQTAGRDRIVLERLSQEEATELVRRSLGLSNHAPRFEARLYKESGGNPLFVLETLHALHDEGLLYRDENGRWSTPWDESTDMYEELPVAPALRDVVESRLTHLAFWTRRVLNLAAVIGDDVELEWLLHGSDTDESVVLTAVDDLLQRGFLRETEDENQFRFSHNQIQKIAYETIEQDERRRLHRRAAELLDENTPDRIEDMARHHTRGQNWEPAVEYLLRAAERAKDVYATETALDYADRALHILDTHDPVGGLRSSELRYDLLAIRRFAYWVKGDVTGQKETLEALQQVAGHLEDTRRTVDVLTLSAFFSYSQEEHETARAYAHEAVSLAEQQGLTRQAALAQQCIGQSYYRCDQYEQAETTLQRSLETWKAVEESALDQATAHVRLAQVYQKQGMIDAAEAHCQKALTLAEPSQDPYVLLNIYNQLASAATSKGDYEASAEYERAGLEQARAAGFRFNEAVLLSNLGISYWGLRQYETAVSYMRDGLALYHEIEDRRGVAVSLENLGHLYREIGQYERAQAAIDEGLELAETLDHPFLYALLLCDRGRLALVEGDQDTAQDAFRDAVEVAEEVQSPYIRGHVDLCLGLHALARHDKSAARHHFQNALVIFNEGDEADWVTVARSYLATCHLSCDRADDAVRLSSDAVRHLEDKAGGEEILAIYRNHWRIMRTTGHHAEAAAILETAYAELQSQRETLPDDWQPAFIERVPVHQEIAEAYAKMQAQTRAGSVIVRLPHVDAPLGRALRDDEWVEVNWTVEAQEDEKIAGKRARRQHRILRLLREAEAQNAAPRVADLAEVLDVSAKTIKRDLSALRDAGHEVQTRGSR